MVEIDQYSDDPLVGTAVREYLIVSKIGEGGMGTVYKAYHQILMQYRALKVLRKELLGDEAFIARFLREAKILTEIHHINVARFFEFFQQEDGTLFMAMEFVEGERLDQRLQRRGWLTEKELIPLFREVCEGIAEAHSRDIIHRDIAPDNIMLVSRAGKEGVKILDFGIAKNPQDQDKTSILTQTGVFIGKYRYCSPEQAEGEEQDLLDQRSDIYSIGLVMYETLAGNSPFEANNPQVYLLKQMTESPIPLTDRNPAGTISPEMIALINKMLEKQREKRPQTVQEVLWALDRLEKETDPGWGFPEKQLQSDIPTEPGRPGQSISKADLPRPWLSSRKKAVGLVSALCVLLTVVIIIAYHFLSSPSEPAVITVNSIPSGANIVIDNVHQPGTTPYTIQDIQAGKTHHLVIEKTGYARWSREFKLESGTARIFTAKLKEKLNHSLD